MTGALEARLGVRRGEFELDAELLLEPGTVLAVVGRNGAGKSTALAALAGVTSLSMGRIVLDGVLLDDAGAGFVPPERRAVGLVLQQPALFPHLTVRDNVAFGLRTRGAPKAEAREQATAALDEHGLGEFADRHPAQRQRLIADRPGRRGRLAGHPLRRGGLGPDHDVHQFAAEPQPNAGDVRGDAGTPHDPDVGDPQIRTVLIREGHGGLHIRLESDAATKVLMQHAAAVDGLHKRAGRRFDHPAIQHAGR